ncbi:hypothetical protein B0H14DRAFT_2583596 [Mycena olivaceomarginata]|nr:hypothetical protein B0H14DRAFT_2583596 [Mycena olivaceomarginata]
MISSIFIGDVVCRAVGSCIWSMQMVSYCCNMRIPLSEKSQIDYTGSYRLTSIFNAVTNLATSNNTNIYGSTWTGPPNANFGGDNQTTALGALLSAIALETPSSLSSSSSVSPSPTNSPSPIATHATAEVPSPWSHTKWQRSTRNTDHSSRSPRTPPFLTSSITPFTTQTSIMTSLSPGNKNGEHRGLRPPSPTHVAAMEDAAREGGDQFNVVANTDFGDIHAVNSPAETHQMDPSVGDENRSVENSPVGRNPAPIHPLITQETHQIESATIIADEDRVNVNVEDSAASVLPTEMLLKILSQRIQRQQLDEGDNPPEYATAHVLFMSDPWSCALCTILTPSIHDCSTDARDASQDRTSRSHSTNQEEPGARTKTLSLLVPKAGS